MQARLTGTVMIVSMALSSVALCKTPRKIVTVDQERIKGFPSVVGLKAAILDDRLPEMAPKLAARFENLLRRMDLRCDRVKISRLEDWEAVRQEYGLVVLPSCRALPPQVIRAISMYLGAGGRTLFIGGPAFETRTYRVGDTWYTQDEVYSKVRMERELFPLTEKELARWTRNANMQDSGTQLSVESTGPGGAPAMRADLDFTGDVEWDLPQAPPLPNGIPATQTVTTFWAKADPDTKQLFIEWKARDGSRTKHIIDLTPQWRSYAIPLRDFKFFQESGPRADQLDPSELAVFSFGLAKGEFAVKPGHRTIWISQIGVAHEPVTEDLTEIPVIEGISPGYKVLRIGRMAGARLLKPDGSSQPMELSKPFEALITFPRPMGMCVENESWIRWTPLAEGLDDEGRVRGTIAAVLQRADQAGCGGAWGHLGVVKPADLLDTFDAWSPVIRDVVRRLLAPATLVKAGTTGYSYWTGEPVGLGAVVRNVRDKPVKATLRLNVRRRESSRPIFKKRTTLSVKAWGEARLDLPEKKFPTGTYVVRTELVSSEKQEVPDVIEYEFRVIKPKKAKAEEFVRVEGNRFMLGDQPWYAHGLNYWPLNVSGYERDDYWGGWLRPGYYLPHYVERDLELAEQLGINAVSIQLNTGALPAFGDFLARCERHGIRVSVYEPHTNPLWPDLEKARDLLKASRIGENPTVYALDLAWEPHLGPYERRLNLWTHWRDWVVEQYGSGKKAERDWGVAVPVDEEGRWTPPTFEQIHEDGPWKRFVAAYRRFLDDFISRRMVRIEAVCREVCPHQLLSWRCGYGGTAQPGPGLDSMQFDLVSAAKHLDFISPEAWGYGPDSMDLVDLVNAYARFAGNDKPVFWAENGLPLPVDVNKSSRIHRGSEPCKIQAENYRAIGEMLLRTGAVGQAGWWWPGGLRVGENSDFGVIEPDGLPREAALVMQEMAEEIKAARQIPIPNKWIMIDRDLDVRGMFGIRETHRDEFSKLRDAGHTIGLRTEGTGTDSAKCPAVAVGNVPWDGQNPPKYLNAEFNWLQIRPEGGQWMDALGEPCTVTPGVGLSVKLSVGNTGEATWLARVPGYRPGAVVLEVQVGPEIAARVSIPKDVPQFGDVDFGVFEVPGSAIKAGEVVFRLMCTGRTGFGEVVRVGIESP